MGRPCYDSLGLLLRVSYSPFFRGPSVPRNFAVGARNRGAHLSVATHKWNDQQVGTILSCAFHSYACVYLRIVTDMSVSCVRMCGLSGCVLSDSDCMDGVGRTDGVQTGTYTGTKARRYCDLFMRTYVFASIRFLSICSFSELSANCLLPASRK